MAQNFSFKYVYKAWQDRNVTNDLNLEKNLYDKQL